MKTMLDRHDLLGGALRCLNHAAVLIRDAARLLEDGAANTSLMLAASAREELGKCGTLLRLEGNLGSAGVEVATVRAALHPPKSPHERKLAAGQSTFLLAEPPPRGESPAERRQRQDVMRQADAKALHGKRMAAQYVDLRADGTWSDPGAAVSFQEAQTLVHIVAEEVAELLRWAREETEVEGLAKVVSSLPTPLMTPEERLRRVERVPVAGEPADGAWRVRDAAAPAAESRRGDGVVDLLRSARPRGRPLGANAFRDPVPASVGCGFRPRAPVRRCSTAPSRGPLAQHRSAPDPSPPFGLGSRLSFGIPPPVPRPVHPRPSGWVPVFPFRLDAAPPAPPCRFRDPPRRPPYPIHPRPSGWVPFCFAENAPALASTSPCLRGS